MFSYEKYEESAKYIKEKIVIKYNEIPNFPVSTVEGHAGELIIGKLGGKEIIAMNRKISLL